MPNISEWHNDFNPAAVLFEFDGLRRDIAPSRTQRKDVAGPITAGIEKGCRGTEGVESNWAIPTYGIPGTISARDNKSPTDLVVQPIPYRVTFCDANGTRKDRPNGGLYISQPDVSGTLTGAASDLKIAQPIPINSMNALQPICFGAEMCYPQFDFDFCQTMRAKNQLAVCFQQNTRDEVRLIGGEGIVAGALSASAGMKKTNYIAQPIPINSMNAFRSPDADKSTGCGIGEEGEAMFTITKTNHHAVAAQGITLHGTDGTQSVASFTELSSSLRARIPSGVENSTTTAVLQSIGFTRCDHGGDATIEGTPTMRCGSNYSAHLAAAVMQSIAFEPGFLKREGTHFYHEHTGVIRSDPGDNAMAVACVDVAGTMKACKDSGGWSNSADHAAAGYMQPVGMQVRRLTPTECERLQGFPDGYTQVPHRGKPAADGPRYKSLGNSMAVPVMAWIGKRIDQETKLREKA